MKYTEMYKIKNADSFEKAKNIRKIADVIITSITVVLILIAMVAVAFVDIESDTPLNILFASIASITILTIINKIIQGDNNG